MRNSAKKALAFLQTQSPIEGVPADGFKYVGKDSAITTKSRYYKFVSKKPVPIKYGFGKFEKMEYISVLVRISDHIKFDVENVEFDGHQCSIEIVGYGATEIDAICDLLN